VASSANTHANVNDDADAARPVTDWLKGRWPTALAVALAAGFSTGSDLPEDAAQFLFVLPLEYVVVARFGSQRATWPVIGVLATVTAALAVSGVAAPPAVASVVALLVLVWSAVDGLLLRSDAFRVQTLGMLAFGALGLAALAVNEDLGRYLVAAGWCLHGVWDFVHLKLDKVVARSYAESCGVFDLLVAAGLVLLG